MTGLPLRDSFLWQNFIERHSDLFIDERDSASDSGNGDDESAILDLMDDHLSSWPHLPDIVLEQVFSYLSLRDRYHASLVCKNWYQVFYSPAIWRKLVMTANAFTHKRYTPHKGYWTELSHHKVQMCLKKVGSYIQTIVIEPISEFYNLYEFLRIWNMFLEYHVKQYPMESLNSFCFTFCCESREQSEVFIYGTGGKLLAELKRLLNNLRNLKTLKLNNLMLELCDAPGVLEPVVHRCPSITYLEIRNYTKELYPLFVASMFRNLRTLVISPQHLNSFMVLRLAESKVNNLHIVQDHYCDEQYFIEPETWKVLSEKAQNLNIYLCVEGQSAMEVNWQEGAPVTAITYTSKFSRVFPMAVDSICCRYSTTLQMYGHYNLPRFHGARSFHDRCDSDLVKLVRHCRKLHTLIIRDRISTATLIILAREGKRLRHLLVRKNSIIKRCDWSRAGSWDEDFYWTMRRASHSYEETFAEVSRCLGYSWQPLTDKMFMRLLPPHLSLSAESDIDTS